MSEPPLPRIARTIAELRDEIALWRMSGHGVALVPTMGGLHDGHLALVRHARKECERTVVSIFVNPIQFNQADDFHSYPRDLDGDRAKLARLGVELVFAPDAGEMYADGFATTISVGNLSSGLCGPHRPGHFDGVATVVAKLLLQSLPDVAVFGEKDWQQLQIIGRMVRDLDIPVRIDAVATVREADGLAMASRNVFLSPEERKIAATLARVLGRLVAELSGGAEAAPALARGREELARAGFAKIDYLEVVEAATLKPVSRVTGPARVAVAAWAGRTRLIDNMAVEPRG
jgi:pantoate--beta-alanine ligase